MKLECVEAFADAAVRVLAAMFGDEFGCGAPRLALAEEPGEGVTVRVRFSGDHEGHLALRVDQRTALRLYALASGETHERLPDLGIDYFLELGNVISGSAVSRLNELGFDVSVQPAELPGFGAAPEASETCQIPVYSPHGGIMVQLTCSA